ncbi:type IV pilin protein [Rheinheimera sp.]|uniref:type IV pilin protein n=1 Tax=Rheinheimera sp. TaxID=1869214 RepID=UPI0027BA40E9|nr:type IV pilin protein [Rheinheimera sp.]
MNSTANVVFGFVLIEIMVVVALIGIILSVAIPGYQQHVLSSYRREACAELLKVANMQQLLLAEQYRYSADLTEFGFPDSSYLTESGRFRISALLTSQGYQLSAAATGVQQQDKDCLLFRLDQYGVKSSQPETTCWLQ